MIGVGANPIDPLILLRSRILTAFAAPDLGRALEDPLPTLGMAGDLDLVNDPNAYPALYRQFITPVYRYSYAHLYNKEDAEDICQQVFMEVLEGLMRKKLKPDQIPAIFFVVARRRIIDLQRKKKASPLDEFMAAAGPNTEISLVERAEIETLLAALENLRPEERERIILRFSAEMSFGEIAKLAGKNEASEKMAFYRSLDVLRGHWERQYGQR